MTINCAHLAYGKCTHEKVAQWDADKKRCLVDIGVVAKCTFQTPKKKARKKKK